MNWGPVLTIIEEENVGINEALASYNHSIYHQISPA